MSRTIRLSESQDDRIRRSATPSQVAPLFATVTTTKAMAILATCGPMTFDMLVKVRPGLDSAVLHYGLSNLLSRGVLTGVKSRFIRRSPVIYTLNERHTLYRYFKPLCRAIWTYQLEKTIRFVPNTSFFVPRDMHRDADNFDELYSASTFHGEILHLLAEFAKPVEQVAIRELLGRNEGGFNIRVSRLVAFGLVRERYESIYRWLELDAEHPLAPSLKDLLRKANRFQYARYLVMAERYRERKSSGEYEAEFRRKRTRALDSIRKTHAPDFLFSSSTRRKIAHSALK